MKKVILSAIFGLLFVASCSKKNDNALQDSNIMLEEPSTPTVDTAAAATAQADSTTQKVEVAATAKDSLQTK